jgi:hypothetical protein
MIDFIKKFLNKEKNILPVEEDYCDQFSKIQIDINNIKSSYPEMIRKSLEYDFSRYKEFIDSGYLPKSDLDFWYIDSFDSYNKFALVKNGNSKSIKLMIEFRHHTNSLFSIERSYLYPTSEFLRSDKLDNILTNYYFYYKVRELNILKKKEIENRDHLTSVIGKDVRRDSIIDQLLND